MDLADKSPQLESWSRRVLTPIVAPSEGMRPGLDLAQGVTPLPSIVPSPAAGGRQGDVPGRGPHHPEVFWDERGETPVKVGSQLMNPAAGVGNARTILPPRISGRRRFSCNIFK